MTEVSDIVEGRTFPILKQKYGAPKESVPWSLVEPHRAQADRNHYQTLEQLAGRGGLSWCELAAVIGDRKWHAMPEDEAREAVRAALLEQEGRR